MARTTASQSQDTTAEGSVSPEQVGAADAPPAETKSELQEMARELEIPGRSHMNKDELASSVLESVARRTLDGEFGAGLERRKNLKAAGYNPNDVQREVNRLLNQ